MFLRRYEMTFRLPNVGESVFVTGNPKSGKTTLARWLAKEWAKYHKHVLIFMSDCELGAKTWADYCKYVIPANRATINSIATCLMAGEGWVCIDAHEMAPGKPLLKLWETVCAVAKAVGNTLVINDEISRVSLGPHMQMGNYAPYHYLLVSGNGRKRANSIIQATQKPQGCHTDIRDMAHHQFYFRLDDRIVSNYLTYLDKAELITRLPAYHCMYKHITEGGQVVFEMLKPCPIV